MIWLKAGETVTATFKYDSPKDYTTKKGAPYCVWSVTVNGEDDGLALWPNVSNVLEQYGVNKGDTLTITGRKGSLDIAPGTSGSAQTPPSSNSGGAAPQGVTYNEFFSAYLDHLAAVYAELGNRQLPLQEIDPQAVAFSIWKGASDRGAEMPFRTGTPETNESVPWETDLVGEDGPEHLKFIQRILLQAEVHSTRWGEVLSILTGETINGLLDVTVEQGRVLFKATKGGGDLTVVQGAIEQLSDHPEEPDGTPF